MALYSPLAQPPAPSRSWCLIHCPSALVSLPVSPCHRHNRSLFLSPQPLCMRRSMHNSLFAVLKQEAGFTQVEEQEEDLIGAIEVELASTETRLMDAAALFRGSNVGGFDGTAWNPKILPTSNPTQWDDKCGLNDAEATVLAFRLLRLHGHQVSAGVLMALEDGTKSFYDCFSVDSPTNVSAMLNLYRCSQTGFPSESNIMAEAREFARSQLLDVMSEQNPTVLQTNNLRIEVNFALELPRQCLLPRLESRSIIRQLWPGNETTRRYLKLAKLDLRKLQNLYQQELEELERWWQRCGFDDMKRARKILIQAYFIATPRVYEPQFSSFRLAYAKGVALTTVLDDFFDDKSCGFQELQRFYEAFRRWDSSIIDDLPQQKQLFKSIDDAYLEIAAEASKVQGRNVLPLFKDLWVEFVASFLKEAEWMHGQHVPIYEEYIQIAHISVAAKLITWTSAFLLGEKMTDEILGHIGPDSRFTYLTCVVGRLSNDLATLPRELREGKLATGGGSYMRHHPGCTQEEATVALTNFIELASQELEWELYRSRALAPEVCSRAVLGNARSARLLYKKIDGLTNEEEGFMKLFRELIFDPFE